MEKTNFQLKYWSENELIKIRNEKYEYEDCHPMIKGNKGMVVCTTNGVAAHIGSEILRKGGNAADAVIATSLAQVVLAAGSYVSFAGIYTLLYYNKKESKVYSLGAEYAIPKNETDPMSIPKAGSGVPSGRATLVPGYFAGIHETHNKFGRLPINALFEPAIFLAEGGFEFTKQLEQSVNYRRAILSRYEAAKKVFTNKTGDFYKKGDWFKQPELAETLKKVCEQGIDYIYIGEWAEKFIKAIQNEGGKLSLEDMENYMVVCGEPVNTTYRDYTLYGPALPNIGGIKTLLVLNTLEAGNIGGLGHYTESPEALLRTIQAGRTSEIVNDIIRNSPVSFKELNGKRISLDNILDKENAKLIWELMKDGELPKTCTKAPGNHSDGIVSIDNDGNMAAVIHTSNTNLWGETGLFVDGISIPDSASFQQFAIKAAGAGNKLPVGTNPILVIKGGEPFMASSSIGAGILQKTYCALFNTLEFGMDLKSAQDTPNHLLPDVLGDGSDLLIEAQFNPLVINSAKEMGLRIKDASLGKPVFGQTTSARAIDGMWIAVQRDIHENYTYGITCKYFNGSASSETDADVIQ